MNEDKNKPNPEYVSVPYVEEHFMCDKGMLISKLQNTDIIELACNSANGFTYIGYIKYKPMMWNGEINVIPENFRKLI